jgi:hypothetical protein
MEKFDSYIKSKVEQMEIEPPAGFWHQISEELNTTEASIDKTVTKKKFSYTLFLKIAAVFIGVFYLGNNLNFSKQEENQTSISEEPKIQVAVEVSNIHEASYPVTNLNSREKVKINSLNQKAQLKAIESEIRNTETEIELNTNAASISEETFASEEVKNEDKEFDLTETNIPVYALKILNKNVPENDEFSIIAPKTKETQKKVIVIEKGISKQPSIDVRIPYRF